MKLQRYAFGFCVAALLSAACAADSAPKPLVEFKPGFDVDSLKLENEAEAKITTVDGTSVLEMKIPAGKNYPGIVFSSPDGKWDLSAYQGVEAVVTNTSSKPLTISIRADNDGDWKKNPWNAEVVHGLKPGASKSIRVTFGRSWGNKGYPLNAAAVSSVRVFTEKVSEESTLVIKSLAPFGTASAAPAAEAPAAEKAAAAKPAAAAGSAVVEGKKLVEITPSFDADSLKTENGAEVKVVTADGSSGIEMTTPGGRDYPGVIFPASGTWDLSAYQGVQATVTNTGTVALSPVLRVDDDGDWKKNPWNAEILHGLKPGATKTIRVTFGRSWGNKGYALNTQRILNVRVFTGKTAGEGKLVIKDIMPFGKASDVKAEASAAPTASSDEAVSAVAPPISGELIRFQNADEISGLKPDGVEVSQVQQDGKPALKAVFEAGKQYPGVGFPAPGGAWNLGAFGGVQAELTNVGSAKATIALRVDEKGDWKKNPWNTEMVSLKPGEKKTISVIFGRSNGAPGYPVNSKRIAQVLMFTINPKQNAEIVVTELKAFGSSSARELDEVADDGTMVAFGPDFDVAQQAEGREANVKVAGKQLQVDYAAAPNGWPALALRPRGKKWDLSLYSSLQFDVTNTSSQVADIMCRVDNPGADGNKNCKTVGIKIAPNETKTLAVNFGGLSGPDAEKIDMTNIVGLLVFANKPADAMTVKIGKVTATKRKVADLPDWLGQRPPVAGDWVQTFNDNFDSLNENVWTTRMWWDGPEPGHLQRYVKENVIIDNGILRIKSEKKAGHQYDDPKLQTREFTSGYLATNWSDDGKRGWTQLYGYFEARMKLPTARGLWPAFWMMPDRGVDRGTKYQRTATEKGAMELDIMEQLAEWGPGRYNIAVHWDGYGKDHKAWGTDRVMYLPTPGEWHNIGALWEPGKITWYCDGLKKAEYSGPGVGKEPMFFIINLQMGHWATKDVDLSKLPDYFEIDYVRAWQLRSRMAK